MGQVAFGFRVNCVGTTARVHCYSFSNADITITIAGETPDVQTLVNTLLNDGAGAPTDSYDTVKLYYGTSEFSGLTADTEYTFTAVQGANTRTGAFRTDPGLESDFSMFFILCDKNGATGEESEVGCYGYIKSYAQNSNLPVHSLHHYDDHGYVDKYDIQDQAGTGAFYPDTAPTINLRDVAYQKSLCYAAYEGMLVLGPGTETIFHATERQWCHANLNNFLQVGDHEITNNPEESDAITALNYTAAKKAWVATIGGAMDYIDADPVTNSKSLAWVNVIGPIEFIAYDRLFSLTGEQRVFNETTQAVENAAWLTAAQIGALLGEINSTSPFKCLASGAGVRAPLKKAERLALIADGWPSAWLGAQQPIHTYSNDDADGDGVGSEFRDLMTVRPTSIGAISEAYGGKIFAVHGDTHRPCEYQHYFPQDAANAELNLMEISPGSVNGSLMHNIHPKFKSGLAWGGTKFAWQYGETVYSDDTATQIHRNTCVRFDVHQSGSERYIDVHYIEVEDPDASPTVGTVLRTTRITTGKEAGNFRQGFI